MDRVLFNETCLKNIAWREPGKYLAILFCFTRSLPLLLLPADRSSHAVRSCVLWWVRQIYGTSTLNLGPYLAVLHVGSRHISLRYTPYNPVKVFSINDRACMAAAKLAGDRVRNHECTVDEILITDRGKATLKLAYVYIFVLPIKRVRHSSSSSLWRPNDFFSHTQMRYKRNDRVYSSCCFPLSFPLTQITKRLLDYSSSHSSAL